MKTYDFDEKDGDACLYFDAQNKKEAIKKAKSLLKDFSLWRIE